MSELISAVEALFYCSWSHLFTVPFIFAFFVFSSSLSSGAWVGLSDEAMESDWRWLNGAPLYYEMAYEEPQGGRTEQCGGTWYNYRRLYDAPCTWTYYGSLCSSIGKLFLKFQYIFS